MLRTNLDFHQSESLKSKSNAVIYVQVFLKDRLTNIKWETCGIVTVKSEIDIFIYYKRL